MQVTGLPGHGQVLQGPTSPVLSLQPELKSVYKGPPEGWVPKQHPEGTARISVRASRATPGHFLSMQRMLVLLGPQGPGDGENSLLPELLLTRGMTKEIQAPGQLQSHWPSLTRAGS